MVKKNIQSILQDALEQEIPSSQVELWPVVKASLVAGKHLSNQQGDKMYKTSSRRILRAAFITLMVGVLLALAFITPQGQAFAQSILQFFTRAQSDTITPEPVTFIDVTPGVPFATLTPLPAFAPPSFASDCGDFTVPTCTIEQIRNKVDFKIKEPGNVPEGIYFLGATGSPDYISFVYYSEDSRRALLVSVEPWTGSPNTDIVGASATVEEVKIGSLTGEYVKGGFFANAGETITNWDPNLGNETLRWVDDGILYTMVDYSAQKILLGKEGMVALAESMTTEPVAKLPAPVLATPAVWNPNDTYNLTGPEAEEQAGFKLLLPSKLPENLPLVGATIGLHHQNSKNDSKDSIVEVFYGTDMNGLVLLQQVALNPEGCKLCGFSRGDGTVGEEDGTVSLDANLETVQIGDLTGQYVEGGWTNAVNGKWQWDPTPWAKTLRWWANGRAFEIMYFGNIEKADLIKIAESLK